MQAQCSQITSWRSLKTVKQQHLTVAGSYKATKENPYADICLTYTPTWQPNSCYPTKYTFVLLEQISYNKL